MGSLRPFSDHETRVRNLNMVHLSGIGISVVISLGRRSQRVTPFESSWNVLWLKLRRRNCSSAVVPAQRRKTIVTEGLSVLALFKLPIMPNDGPKFRSTSIRTLGRLYGLYRLLPQEFANQPFRLCNERLAIILET